MPAISRPNDSEMRYFLDRAEGKNNVEARTRTSVNQSIPVRRVRVLQQAPRIGSVNHPRMIHGDLPRVRAHVPARARTSSHVLAFASFDFEP